MRDNIACTRISCSTSYYTGRDRREKESGKKKMAYFSGYRTLETPSIADSLNCNSIDLFRAAVSRVLIAMLIAKLLRAGDT